MREFELWAGGPLFRQAEHAKLTTDTVLLADFALPAACGSGADLGCASGALMLLLLWQKPALRMTGLELVDEAVSAAEENLRVNGLAQRAQLIPGDMRETGRKLPNGGFDFVISNPPYYAVERGLTAPEEQRAAARGELTCSLEELCSLAARLCRRRHTVFFSYRPERLAELLRVMSAHRLEPKRLRFVHHDVGRTAMLVLVEGRRDGNPGLSVEAPLLLHLPDGTETVAYRQICRRG